MKASKLRTLWIIIISVWFTIMTCLSAIYMNLTGKINRAWVNKKIQIWVKRILKTIRVHYKVVNPYNTKPQPGTPTIILCNHASLYDIPLSFLAFPQHNVRMLAKKELANIPLMGQAMRAAEFPSIDRKNRKQAIEDLIKVRHLLESGIIMWIAPEGTRSKTGKLAPFKKGPFITAIEIKATIIPIGIRGAYDILPTRTYQLSLNQHAEVHVGKPIDASKYSLENKEMLIEHVHKVMEELVGEIT